MSTIDAILAALDGRTGFRVFKDARGALRWLAVSSSAYRDKDGEIVSTKALRRAVAVGDATGRRGPLRFWHVPGLDLGACDYQATAQDGRFLIESGTFRDARCAAIGLKAADRRYQLSLGFVHPASQPDPGGVFHDIAIFERSLVPPGRAANPFTRLSVKETTMDEAKKKEFVALGGDDALLDGLLASTAKDDAQAQDAGVAFKDAPAWAQALIGRVEALETALKAAAPAAAAEEALDAAEDAGMVAEDEISDNMLNETEIKAISDAVVKAIAPMLDLEKKMAGYLGEMKSMLQPVAQKDDERSQEIAALKERLSTLEGDQPRASRGALGVPVSGEDVKALKEIQDSGEWNGLGSFLQGFQFNGR